MDDTTAVADLGRIFRDFLDMLDGLDIPHRFNRDPAQDIVHFADTNRR